MENESTNFFDTKASFIGRLKNGGDDVWADFYDRYASLILNFAIKRGCSKELAEDILQETVFALYRHMPKFDYEREKGKFRSFLFKITESKIVDSFRRRKHIRLFHNTAIMDAESAKDSTLNMEYIHKLWDKVWEENIISEALSRVRSRVQEKTYLCFEKIFFEGKSVKEVAETFNISPNLVYQHKHKVLTLTVEEAQKLREEYGE